MKSLFPIYIAIITVTIVLVITMRKSARQWSELSQKEKKIRVFAIAAGATILLIGIILFIIFMF
jgi:ABC-type nickel/cobalt efflux system permease component RcnA